MECYPGLVRLSTIDKEGIKRFADSFEWDEQALGCVTSIKTKEGSNLVFLYLDRSTLICLTISNLRKIEKKWETKVSSKGQQAGRGAQEFQCMSMNFLETQRVLLLGGQQNKILAFNIDSSKKIGEFISTGLSTNNNITSIAASDKHYYFITSGKTQDCDVTIWRWNQKMSSLSSLQTKPFEEEIPID